MNNSLFFNLRSKIDDEVWHLPIRWWEDDEPRKAKVLRDCGENDKHLYVDSDHYGHPVYITREFVFYTRENAIKAIHILRNLKELIDDDGNDQLMKIILKNLIKKND